MDIFSEMICGYTIFSKRVNKNCTQSVVNCRKKKSSSLHHLFQVINNNVFKTTFPLDHHAIIIAILNVMIVIIQSSWRLEEIPTTPTTYFKGNIILHNLDFGRLKSCHLYYSRVLGLGILPSKSLHICSCHSQQQDCHQCFSTEKTTQEFHINEFSPQKNAENPLSKMGPTTIFGKLNFIMPNIAQFFWDVTMLLPYSQNGKVKTFLGKSQSILSFMIIKSSWSMNKSSVLLIWPVGKKVIKKVDSRLTTWSALSRH